MISLALELVEEHQKLIIYFSRMMLSFFRTNPTTCSLISKITFRFCSISGEQINFSKSLIKFSPNTSDSQRTLFKEILGVTLAQNIGTHLGIPIDITESKSKHSRFAVDKVAKKIHDWNCLPLSFTSKIILINTILAASTSHIMVTLPVPMGITTKN